MTAASQSRNLLKRTLFYSDFSVFYYSFEVMNILESFITLWVVIDPIGTIPVFIAVTTGMNAATRRSTAFTATFVSIGVLLFFLILGQLLIDALGISLLSFQVAGGIVLFLFALTMIFGEPKQETDLNTKELDEERPKQDRPSPAIFPLAVPSLASPGAMLAIVLLTDNNEFSILSQAVTAMVMVAVLLAAFVAMLMAEPIIRLIGNSGAAIISRVMGMILASVAADAVLTAILEILRTGSV
ncbi:MarC family protein [Phaeobacter gallaeciensis]|uniref:UPF0056 membrane protein n=3 Tax=Roseobacteraceae TaxID=2854170 RepID=A0A366X168_9RHOB|nr:MarC family protein [Phaeobacter gallaeciensis]